MDQQETIRVERMTTSDVMQVYALERSCFTAPWDLSSYYREMQNPTAYYLVVRVNDRLAGYGGMWAIGDEAHVVTLAVQRDYRRRGLGRLLLQGLLAEARRRGVTQVTLEVRVSNVAAQGLYAQFGFHVIGHRRRYYPDNGEDAAVMELKLGADGRG